MLGREEVVPKVVRKLVLSGYLASYLHVMLILTNDYPNIIRHVLSQLPTSDPRHPTPSRFPPASALHGFINLSLSNPDVLCAPSRNYKLCLLNGNANT